MSWSVVSAWCPFELSLLDLTPGLCSTPLFTEDTSNSEKEAWEFADVSSATKIQTVKTLGSIFKKPKYHPAVNQVKIIVYKVNCKTCDFTYVGESMRPLNSRGADHIEEWKRNWAPRRNNGHKIHPDYVEILERNVNHRQEGLFWKIYIYPKNTTPWTDVHSHRFIYHRCGTGANTKER